MELPPPESSEDEEVGYSTPMKDESLEKIALKDADLPIVAQVEVLYDLEQAFTPNEEDDGEDFSRASLTFSKQQEKEAKQNATRGREISLD